jgi:hypothetical protein
MENLTSELENIETEVEIQAEMQFFSDLKEFSNLINRNNSPLKAVNLFQKIMSDLNVCNIFTRQKLMNYLNEFISNCPSLNFVHQKDYRLKIKNLFVIAYLDFISTIQNLDEIILDNQSAFIRGQNTAINKRLIFIIRYTNFSTK